MEVDGGCGSPAGEEAEWSGTGRGGTGRGMAEQGLAAS